MEYGNIEFNNGLKESIYAYHIKKIHMLKTPLYIKELKEGYNFYEVILFELNDFNNSIIVIYYCITKA